MPLPRQPYACTCVYTCARRPTYTQVPHLSMRGLCIHAWSMYTCVVYVYTRPTYTQVPHPCVVYGDALLHVEWHGAVHRLVHTCIRACTHACMHACIRMHTGLCTHAYMQACTYTHAHRLVHTRMHTEHRQWTSTYTHARIAYAYIP